MIFQILSKSLFYLMMPLIWIIGLFAASLFLKNTKWKKRCLIGGFIALLFFTNTPLVNFLFQWYETKPTPIASLPVYEAGVVLTGIAHTEMEPNDRVYYNRGADRILHAAQLYKEKKIKRIIITGGVGRIFTGTRSEAGDLKKTLLLHEIPDSAIVLENNSFNTRENALFTKPLLDSLSIDSKVLLITSAYHMPRAKGCFAKVGISFDSFATDYYQNKWKWTPDFWLVPSEKALLGWHILIREWLGYATYRMMGYV
jgi:uncharacterized SAM-binding protein YcdF (DUF218 family)